MDVDEIIESLKSNDQKTRDLLLHFFEESDFDDRDALFSEVIYESDAEDEDLILRFFNLLGKENVIELAAERLENEFSVPASAATYLLSNKVAVNMLHNDIPIILKIVFETGTSEISEDYEVETENISNRVNAKPKHDNTSLKDIISKGADLKLLDYEGQQYFHMFMDEQNFEAMQLMLDSGYELHKKRDEMIFELEYLLTYVEEDAGILGALYDSVVQDSFDEKDYDKYDKSEFCNHIRSFLYDQTETAEFLIKAGAKFSDISSEGKPITKLIENMEKRYFKINIDRMYRGREFRFSGLINANFPELGKLPEKIEGSKFIRRLIQFKVEKLRKLSSELNN